MPTNRDSRGNVPDVVSSIDRTPCAVCQQPLRRDEAATYRGEPVHATCVPTREPCLLADGGHAVAGLCAHDDCDGTVVWVDGTPQCKKCTRRWAP